MSACQSQPAAGSSAASCASAGLQPAGSIPLPVMADGAELINISDSVVTKVAEMLAEEGDPSLQLRIYVTARWLRRLPVRLCL